jgi:glycosyltransferase involved in cell wall biosynthesis
VKKILVVNDFPIFPIVSGGKVRIFNIYQNISKEFHVSYVCLGNSKAIEEKKISEYFNEVIVPKQIFYKIIALIALKVLRCSVGDFVALFLASNNGKLKRVIREQISESDIVIFSHPYLYPAVKPFITNQKTIYEAHNVEYLLKRSILGKGFMSTYLLNRLKKTERELLQKCSLCFSMSESDKDELIRLYKVDPSKIYVAPNGVDPGVYNDFFSEGNRVKNQVNPQPLIIFLGSGHPPNVEAARQIIKNIAPQMPNTLFVIAGGVSNELHTDFPGENVCLRYFIPEDEKKELFRTADIAINPMMSGSGTNIKMLDFMAAGIPVISTPTGARGIAIENYHHAIICDIDIFPPEISRLLHDNKLYETLSISGRKLIEEKYDWKIIAGSMIKRINREIGESTIP